MVPGEVVVWLEQPGVAPDLTAQGLDLLRSDRGPVAVYRVREATARPSMADAVQIEFSAEYATATAALAVEDAVGIRDAEPNYVYQRTGLTTGTAPAATGGGGTIPNDPFLGFQWHYDQLNLRQAWALTQGSASTVVAVIDTGIVAAHPDFDPGRFVPGFDMILDPASAGDGNGRDPNPNDEGDGNGLQPSSFHGTHVAGTIGARTNNSLGIAGVDWTCKLMVLRALGKGGGTNEDIANSILFAARLTNASGTLPAQRADVINMSLGGPGSSSLLTNACNAADAEGCLIVAAAGNDNTSTAFTPASIPVVVSVGATDLARRRAPYSNFSNTIDLWAPGGNMAADLNGDQRPDGVLSNMATDTGTFLFAFENGTSMASPHVAGVAALLKAANPVLTSTNLRAILTGNTQAGVSLPNNGRLMDALAAVQGALGGGTGTAPVLVATPTALDFGQNSNAEFLNMENRGGGRLVSPGFGTSPNVPWLTVTDASTNPPANISADVLRVAINRASLAAGTNQTTLTIGYLVEGTTTEQTVDIDIRVQNGAPPTSTDTVFVLLVDAATLDSIAQDDTTAAAQFRYTLAEVPTGTYLLAAGTDRDNDGFIGDPGELFGMWPLLDTPLDLEVTGGTDLSGLDFLLEELDSTPTSRTAGRWQPLRLLRSGATEDAGRGQ
jgi:serine protease